MIAYKDVTGAEMAAEFREKVYVIPKKFDKLDARSGKRTQNQKLGHYHYQKKNFIMCIFSLIKQLNIKVKVCCSPLNKSCYFVKAIIAASCFLIMK